MSIIDYGNDIHKDTNVYGENVYIGNGQGCGTFWFKSVEHARKYLDRFGMPKIPKVLCEKCSCHYSYGTREYKKYPEYNCNEFIEFQKRRGLL